jgi:hypothetical protein
MNIKTEIIYKSNSKCQAGRLGYRDLVVELKEGVSARALSENGRITLIKVDNILQEQISVYNLNSHRIVMLSVVMLSVVAPKCLLKCFYKIGPQEKNTL